MDIYLIESKYRVIVSVIYLAQLSASAVGVKVVLSAHLKGWVISHMHNCTMLVNDM